MPNPKIPSQDENSTLEADLIIRLQVENLKDVD
jgi:hypothetical protein